MFRDDKGLALWMGGVVVFVFPLYYLYDGEHSGTVIAQLAAVFGILLEFSESWKPRISEALPLWVMLVPGSTYVTYLTFGLEDALWFFISLGFLTAVALAYRRRKSSRLGTSRGKDSSE